MKIFTTLKTKTLGVTVFIIFTGSIVGCGFFESKESLEKDKAELLEILNGIFVTYWKGAKLSFRSLPITPATESIDFEKIRIQQAQQLNLGKHLSRIYDNELFLKDIDEKIEPFTAKEFIEFAKELYAMSDTIKDIDEDEYPTFVEMLSNSRSALKGEPIDFPEYWNNSMDHWLFAIIMETEFGLGSWKTYELDKVNPKELETTDLRVAAALHRGINFLRNEWFYLADQTFTQNLVELEKNTITFQPDIQKIFSSTMKSDMPVEEQFRCLFRASTYLLRGFSRHQTGDSEMKEKALKDVESGITDFSKLGIDNEFVWIAESYVFIKNEDSQKAMNSLSKLERSAYLTPREKKLIARTKEHIKKRDPESALNFLTDKIIMYQLGVSYAVSYAIEIEWMQLLEKTEEGKRILTRFKELEQIYEKGKNYLDLDELAIKGERLFKELTKQEEN